ncbi:MIP/aquaporin family protein [Actinopolyspora mortivallis]|uniref:MIP/aquaporin family protein n=1 Tax=Actinopolyspora mortivallis TaxID=33906 RepID=UPI00036D6577|nr:MIP/aquaporin family protein [Actinopolyspora mortivallis]
MTGGTDSAHTRWRYRRGLGGEMLAEILGTFVLILLGCGSVAVAVAALPESGRQVTEFGPANWLIIIWGWGFGVVFGVYVAGGVSGAHINPAVTLAFAVRRGFPLYKVVPYWFAQVVGAFLAAAVVHAVYAPALRAFEVSSGTPRAESLDTFSVFATFPAEYFGGGWWGPLLDQIVGTAVLVGLICALIDRRNMAPASNLGPFLIGMVVTVVGLTFGPGAGYAINPARDFGPRLWTYLAGWQELAFPGSYEWFSWYFWIPIVGPLVGGVLGAVVYDLFVGHVLADRAEPEVGRVPE